MPTKSPERQEQETVRSAQRQGDVQRARHEDRQLAQGLEARRRKVALRLRKEEPRTEPLRNTRQAAARVAKRRQRRSSRRRPTVAPLVSCSFRGDSPDGSAGSGRWQHEGLVSEATSVSAAHLPAASPTSEGTTASSPSRAVAARSVSAPRRGTSTRCGAGLRRSNVSWIAWLPDVLCLQETKIAQLTDAAAAMFEHRGHRVAHAGRRSQRRRRPRAPPDRRVGSSGDFGDEHLDRELALVSFAGGMPGTRPDFGRRRFMCPHDRVDQISTWRHYRSSGLVPRRDAAGADALDVRGRPRDRLRTSRVRSQGSQTT